MRVQYLRKKISKHEPWVGFRWVTERATSTLAEHEFSETLQISKYVLLSFNPVPCVTLEFRIRIETQVLVSDKRGEPLGTVDA